MKDKDEAQVALLSPVQYSTQGHDNPPINTKQSMVVRGISWTLSVATGATLVAFMLVDSSATADRILNLKNDHGSNLVRIWVILTTAITNFIQLTDSTHKVIKEFQSQCRCDSSKLGQQIRFSLMATASFAISAIKMIAITEQNGGFSDQDNLVQNVLSLGLSGFSGINYLWSVYKNGLQPKSPSLSFLSLLAFSPSLLAGAVNLYFAIFNSNNDARVIDDVLMTTGVTLLSSGSICSRILLGDLLHQGGKFLNGQASCLKKAGYSFSFIVSVFLFSGGFCTLAKGSLQSINLVFKEDYQTIADMSDSHRIIFFIFVFNSGIQNYLLSFKQFRSLLTCVNHDNNTTVNADESKLGLHYQFMSVMFPLIPNLALGGIAFSIYKMTYSPGYNPSYDSDNSTDSLASLLPDNQSDANGLSRLNESALLTLLPLGDNQSRTEGIFNLNVQTSPTLSIIALTLTTGFLACKAVKSSFMWAKRFMS